MMKKVRYLLIKRIRQFSYALRHPVGHLILRHVVAAALVIGIASHGRALSWKYVARYLDARISVRTRRDLIEYHYRWMMGRFNGSVFLPEYGRGICVWTITDADGIDYSITLRPSSICALEGEAEFVFEDSDKGRLAFMTFSIVPGEMIGAGKGPAILIGGVQGGYGRRENYRRAAKQAGEITPINLLMIAARAFGDAVGAISLLAVPDEGQVAREYADHLMYISYNRTWTELGGELLDSGYFAFDFHKKPAASLDHLSRAHRARARKKSLRKSALQEDMRTLFIRLCSDNESRISSGTSAP
jgi:uncharacterized protein VirK/YbjX